MKISLFFLLLLTGFAYGNTPAMPAGLQCEYLVNPIGIDAARPRFTWYMVDERPGARQTAWQLTVSTDSANWQQGIVWQSGKTATPVSLVNYQGKALQPFTKYYWQVEVWDKDGVKAASPVASFETGMMDQRNWKGTWISDVNDVNLKPAGQFRKVFKTNKKIRSARAYIAVAGLYELYINGQRIGNHLLDPMYTRFDRRTLYVTHDVTAALRSDSNAIGVLLGNGWYNHQSTAVWYFHKAPWRGRPAFCLDLRVTYEDGSVETITSGRDWKTSLSPVIFNSIYTAEHYDARLEQEGWNKTGFDDSKWKGIFLRAAPSQNIVAQAMQPIQAEQRLPVKAMNKFSDTVYVFDLGRNIAGVSSITVKGEAGTELRLKHGEQVYGNGRVDMSNINVHYRPTDDKDPFQTDIFILSGKGEETFRPRFNYKGFQYVEVTSNKPVTLTTESLSGYFMHSAVPSKGMIASSEPILDKIAFAARSSYLSNLFGYPTDCPQREKNGWTGDAHIAIETGLYNYDGITVYEKWMADHRDEQQPNGVLPSIIPTDGWGYEWGNGPDWTSTIAIIPWNVYLFYGDSKLLADCYDNIKLYVDHINELYPTGLTTWGLGDWVPVTTKPEVEFTSTPYYFTDVTILAKAAKLLGKDADHKKYSALATKIKDAFNAKYLNKQTASYGKGMQTELSMPLYWGMVPEDMKSKVAANLAKRVQQDSLHLNVGLLGTKSILNALSENGYAEMAYTIAAQKTYPSWGWWMVNGATTLYENWPLNAKSDISRNHIMFGEVGAWLFKGIAGIRPDELAPGFKNAILELNFIDSLESYATMHKGPYGNIQCSWKKSNGLIESTITVPPNSTATLLLPITDNKKLYAEGQLVSNANTLVRPAGKNAAGKAVYQLQAGTYHFSIR